MKVIMSRHAMEQARKRGISINEIKETIKKGAKHSQNGKVVSSYRHIKIVFRRQNDKFFIITVMIRRE